MFDLPWYVFALAGAFFVALGSVLEKKTLLHDDALHYSGAVATLLGLLSLPLLFFVDWSNITTTVIGYIFIISLLSMGAFYLTSYAMKGLQVGELSILLALTPVVTALFAFLFLAESLSERAFAGVIVIIFGLVILELPGLWQGRHATGFNRKVKYILATALGIGIYATSAMFDRVVLGYHGVAPFDFLAIVQTFTLINYGAFSIMRGKKDHLLTASLLKQPRKMLSIAFCIMFSRFMHATAISMTYIALASVLKRTSTLFTIALAKSYLHERKVGHKLFAASVVILGIILVIA